ncbi:uncharacterized protein LOC119668153 [Teleopsis dalmanni]|uniref:uncharacterized protein LOC119668153 n=1 Tax=Teleopsis dalmanni TaxID=139649 RepID=UPI0018CFD4E8|nr:uncharacterized protein LOC119668153 [Teleopsis dalmanni]
MNVEGNLDVNNGVFPDIRDTVDQILQAALRESSASLTIEEKQKFLKAIRYKLFTLIVQHMQNFQRLLIISRRRNQQRFRRRQTMMRSFYFQKMLECDTTLIEFISKAHMRHFKEIKQTKNTDSVSTKPIPRNVFDDLSSFTQQQWLTTFRMSKENFDGLCAQLKNLIPPIQNRAQIVPLEKCIAIGLYALASGDEYTPIARLFGVANIIVYKIRAIFIEALLKKLGSNLIKMPKKSEEFQEIRTTFKQASNMPALVLGVIGACELPAINKAENLCKNPITFEALVDDRLLFRKIQLQGDVPSLFIDAPNEILNMELQLVNGKYIPCFAVCATQYYPLRLWLMHQYKNPSAPHEFDFNEAIENLVIFKNEAFRRLFSRWKILTRNYGIEPNTMTLITTACVALHNLCEENEEEFNEDWSEGVNLCDEISSGNVKTLPNATEALTMRNFLARTISSTEM